MLRVDKKTKASNNKGGGGRGGKYHRGQQLVNERKTKNEASIPWGRNMTGEWKMMRRHNKETNITKKG